jgi:hypothetical protein
MPIAARFRAASVGHLRADARSRADRCRPPLPPLPTGQRPHGLAGIRQLAHALPPLRVLLLQQRTTRVSDGVEVPDDDGRDREIAKADERAVRARGC